MSESNPTACQRCKAALSDIYYKQAEQTIVCTACYQQLSIPIRLKGWEAFVRSSLAGGLAAIAAAVAAALIIVATGSDFAIFWIFAAVFIGRAVKVGSEDRGTLIFRLLGMGSLYCAIGLSWLFCGIYWFTFGLPKDESPTSTSSLVSMMKPPSLATPAPSATPKAATPALTPTATPAVGQPKGLDPKTRGVLGILILCALPLLVVLGAPILVMYTSPIAILIYALGMHRVWKTTARESRDLSGPFE